MNQNPVKADETAHQQFMTRLNACNGSRSIGKQFQNVDLDSANKWSYEIRV
jgi:hypothetical protein